MPQLPPVPTTLGVFKAFYAQQCTTLMLREKMFSWSGDDFEVKTVDGQPILKVHGALLSASGRKEVMDMQGRHLFTLRRRHFSFQKSYYAEDPNGQEFLTVDGHFSCKHTSSFRFIETQIPLVQLLLTLFDQSAVVNQPSHSRISPTRNKSRSR